MEFTVLQWNVWFEEDIGRVLTFLRGNTADFICLQELTRGYIKQTQENTWEYLAHELGYHCHFQDMPIVTLDAQWSQANAIFSKLPIQSTSSEWINEAHGTDGYDDQYRAYIDITVNLDGSELTIGTTHMSYTDKLSATPRKLTETSRLTNIVDKKDGRFILAGDLNALPSSPTITEVMKRLRHAGPDFRQNTWTTKPFSYDGFEAKTLDWRLDYIFYKNVDVVKSAILKTITSDHLPILAAFKTS